MQLDRPLSDLQRSTTGTVAAILTRRFVERTTIRSCKESPCPVRQLRKELRRRTALVAEYSWHTRTATRKMW